MRSQTFLCAVFFSGHDLCHLNDGVGPEMEQNCVYLEFIVLTGCYCHKQQWQVRISMGTACVPLVAWPALSFLPYKLFSNTPRKLIISPQRINHAFVCVLKAYRLYLCRGLYSIFPEILVFHIVSC